MRTASLLVLAVLLALLPAAASAQSTGTYSLRAPSRFTLDLGFYHGGNSTFLGSEQHTVFIPGLDVNADLFQINRETWGLYLLFGTDFGGE